MALMELKKEPHLHSQWMEEGSLWVLREEVVGIWMQLVSTWLANIPLSSLKGFTKSCNHRLSKIQKTLLPVDLSNRNDEVQVQHVLLLCYIENMISSCLYFYE